MKPLQFVLALGLAAMMLFGAGAIATYDQMVPFVDRVGPGWFQSVSMFSGNALLLAAIVLSIAGVEIGTRRHGVAAARGLHLGRTTLFCGVWCSSSGWFRRSSCS